ncbi:hypothetical protein SK3146_03162 [Paenibacillus konkukensis]|uniref:Papain-like cysteine peptidase n=1 Tax=Paenibacillus konkukensis TaxID=2020716 RepID=A0ABY4RPR0_9BACL|nr:DUF1796 family putative cysteine peptidase [Paenibacillus konkukensis]UQZ83950.1 hypothetical protein SK3146_03162 [Paenibacillus konkukensis]
MKLDDLKGKYDYVISLGAACQTTYQLQRNGLRTISGPIDWLVTNSLHKLNLALLDKFICIMDKGSLKYEGEHEGKLKMHDTLNDMLSVHDFSKEIGFEKSYENFKEKLDRRIQRFFDILKEAETILFVRTQAYSIDELWMLRMILKIHTKAKFKILAVNYTIDHKIIECNWGIEDVCVVEIPSPSDRWQGDDDAWERMLSGISLKNKPDKND